MELIKAVDRDCEKLRNYAYEAVNALIQAGPRDVIPQIKDMIPPFLGKLEKSLEVCITLIFLIFYF